MNRITALVRGGGDLASGTIHRLHKSGFNVIVLEIPKPNSIRRLVSFSEAIYDGHAVVEDVSAVRIEDPSAAHRAWGDGKVPIMVDPFGKSIYSLKPSIVVDAILAKKNLGSKKTMADITIGLGPGFKAPNDVHAVIETMRGHNLGRVILNGQAQPNTATPGDINGFSNERVMYSGCEGVIENRSAIGDIVKKGQTITSIGNVPVTASMDGLLRGIIRNGSFVKKRLKIADIDPRAGELKNCRTISDKARCISGGVLEAILHLSFKSSKTGVPYSTKNI